MFTWFAQKPAQKSRSNLEVPDRPNASMQKASTARLKVTKEWGVSGRVVSYSEREARTSLARYRCTDKDEDKTWTRRFVEKNLYDQTWYNPNKGKEGLDIRDGWTYYEHVTLARQIVKDHEKTNDYQRAEPGNSQESLLYNPFSTPAEALTEWGLGVALYFSTIKWMVMALLVGGLASIPNIAYFYSKEYGHTSYHQKDFFIMGSAVCEAKEWVACEENWCDTNKLDDIGFKYATSIDSDGVGHILVERSLCNGATLKNGMINYAAIMFLLLFVSLFAWYQNRKTVFYDEEQLTASDYSVIVNNPPEDAYDPEEWREFFIKFADKGIVSCTIVLNNEQLLWPLINRRVLRADLQAHLPNTDIDDDDALARDLEKHIEERDATPKSCLRIIAGCTILPILHLLNRMLPAEKLFEKIKDFEEMILEKSKEKYDVGRVIVTFQTEKGQRAALHSLQAGLWEIKHQKTAEEHPENLFRGEHLLSVMEPEEPSAVRYLEVSFSEVSKFIRSLITMAITIGLVALGGVLVSNTRKGSGVVAAGFLTSILNLLVPKILLLLMFIEKHSSEGGRQRSLYMKVTTFRWFNTAIMARILTPFTHTLGADRSEDLLYAVMGIFIAELLFIPALRLLNIGGLISKHIFAPRAATPHKMYLCFMGSPYNLAERYTDMSKIIFLAFFYCALSPVSLLLGSLALFFQYYVDKFCLMRLWRSAPAIGTKLADFSMRYYFSLAAVICVSVAAYDWANFKFDGICDGNTEIATGVHSVNFSDGGSGDLTLEGGPTVRVCSDSRCCNNIHESVFSRNWRFPPTPGNMQSGDLRWMTNEQEELTNIYGYTMLAAIIIYFLLVWARALLTLLKSLFVGTYEPVGADKKFDFSNVQDIDGYVPQFVHPRFVFPFILCDISNIQKSLIGWHDPDNRHEKYVLMNDVPDIPDGVEDLIMVGESKEANEESDGMTHDESNPIFSIMKTWPPESGEEMSTSS